MITYAGQFLVDSTGKRITKTDGKQLVLGPQNCTHTYTGGMTTSTLVDIYTEGGDCRFEYGGGSTYIGIVHHTDGSWGVYLDSIFYEFPVTGLSIGANCLPAGTGTLSSGDTLTFSCP